MPPEGGQNVLGRYETEYLVLVTTKVQGNFNTIRAR